MLVYAPNGQPQFVPSNSAARSFIRKGYTLQPRKTMSEQPEVDSTTNAPEKLIKINSASSNELIAIDGVGVAKAKKIVDAQPNIKNVNALTDIIDDVDWHAPMISGEPIRIEFD